MKKKLPYGFITALLSAAIVLIIESILPDTLFRHVLNVVAVTAVVATMLHFFKK